MCIQCLFRILKFGDNIFCDKCNIFIRRVVGILIKFNEKHDAFNKCDISSRYVCN